MRPTCFRQYAKEAIHGSSKATSENEKQTLIQLACNWARAALMSERVFESKLYYVAARHW